jgi:hypothetical protein
MSKLPVHRIVDGFELLRPRAEETVEETVHRADSLVR